MTQPHAAAPILPVLLSGGSGARLWPMSRAAFPKQLLPLTGQRPMLAETALRLSDPTLFAPPLVICNAEHRFIVAEQLRDAGITPHAVALEPIGRNTAPAAAAAALIAARTQPDAILLLAPSDAVIRDVPGFLTGARAGLAAAAAGRLVTFGVTPTAPETAYGYIKMGASLAEAPGVAAVERFVEKPNAAVAAGYLAEGNYVWNSGMFLFRADVLLAEMTRLCPEILTAVQAALDAAAEDLDFLRLDPVAFAACPSDSIDYAVMERTDRAAVCPIDVGWSDVGSWAALWDVTEKDADGNAQIGDVAALECRGSYLRTDGVLVAALGLTDMVVVAADDVVLVAPKERSQDVKLLVDKLKAAGRVQVTAHRKCYRPWGWYQGVDSGERFQVKRIMVKPGAKLSMQMHHHRAEHWVVVQGAAKVTRGSDEVLVFENQSIFIPQGEKHRLENPGKLPLHLIEVQSGPYLGEDDIVRFEDVYGRG